MPGKDEDNGLRRHPREVASSADAEEYVEKGLSNSVVHNWMSVSADLRDAAIRIVMSRGRATREQAEDAVADALIKLDHLRPSTQTSGALLVTTALNEFYSGRRREGGRSRGFTIAHDVSSRTNCETTEALADRGSDVLTDIVEAEEFDQRSECVRLALERMPVMDRALLTAYYFDGRSLTSIDQERGDLPGAAKVRLHRARQHLRALAYSKLRNDGPSR